MKLPIYSLKQVKRICVTNTDGTISGDFDEIFTTTQRGEYYDVSVDVGGGEAVLFTYKFLCDYRADAINITYFSPLLDDDVANSSVS